MDVSANNSNTASFSSAFANFSNTFRQYSQQISEKHIVLFLLVVTTVQIVATLTKNNLLHVNIFQMATMTGLFACIQGTDSIFEYIVGGLVASGIAFVSFMTLEGQIENEVVLAVVRFVNNIIIVACLLCFDCFNVAALSYALAAPTLIPQMGVGYLGSYCIGCFFSIFLVFVFSLVTPTVVQMRWF